MTSPCNFSNDNFELTNDSMSNDYVNLSNDANGTGSSGCNTDATTEDTVEDSTPNHTTVISNHSSHVRVTMLKISQMQQM